jgi:hypothetical protein
MELLPNEVLAKILLVLDRYSLNSLILISTRMLKRSNDQELLNTITSMSNVKIPKSQLLVFYDYKLVEPSKYIPVYIGNCYYALVLDDDLQISIAEYCRNEFTTVVEVFSRGVNEFFEIKYRRHYDRDIYLDNEDEDDPDWCTIYSTRGNYKVHMENNVILDILNSIYQEEPFHVISVKLTRY